MIHPALRRLALLALASLAGLVVAASPASATDDPAPGLPPAGAALPGPSPSVGAPAPSKPRRARKIRIRVRYRGRGVCGGVRISVSGAGVAGVRRVEIRSRGRRIARDRSRPFRMRIGSRRLRGSRQIQIRLVGSSVRTIARRLRSCSAKRHVSASRSAFESLPVALALDELLGSSFASTT